MRFRVSNLDGSVPDLALIAIKEPWAKRLIYCDMDGFAMCEDGTLILLDECGNLAHAPEGRFLVTWLESVT